MPPVRPKRGPAKPSPTAFTPANILKSSSVLAKSTTDLHAFLLTCLTSWSDYTEVQKHQIISSFPPAYQSRNTDANGNLECPVSIDFVREDTYLREGVERFKRDIFEGYFDTTWRKNATIAMRDREEGKFDEYLREKVEAEYGEGGLEEEDEESGESDKEWRKNRANGGGKAKSRNFRGGKGKGRPRATAARGELQLAMEMED